MTELRRRRRRFGLSGITSQYLAVGDCDEITFDEGALPFRAPRGIFGSVGAHDAAFRVTGPGR